MPTRPTTYSDDTYVKGIINGDSTIITALYTEYFGSIKRFIQSNSGTEEDARDIFQEAIVVLYRKAVSKQLTLTSSLYTFLYAICKNLWLKQLRRKKADGVTIHQDTVYIYEDDLEATIVEQEQYSFFMSKFRELGKDCQKVLRLFFDRKSMQEIAKLMGYKSTQYAKKRKFICKKYLLDIIRQDDLYEELKN